MFNNLLQHLCHKSETLKYKSTAEMSEQDLPNQDS